jgi:outer membrane protein assembly factor BamB
MAAAILSTCGAATLVKVVGVTGNGVAQFTWRWTDTPEDRLLAQAEAEPRPGVVPAVPPGPPAQESEAPNLAPGPPSQASHPTAAASTAPAARTPANWPGFRGADRSGVIRGVSIDTDWSSAPPTELWRRNVGPGWSSFAINGDVFYTQEQRGGDEIISAYRVSTGAPVWRHADPVRFEEGMGGPGPRATPTLAANRVFTFGGTGLLNALDAANGKLLWSRNAATDLEAATPMWGFAALARGRRPVIIAAGGQLAACARNGRTTPGGCPWRRRLLAACDDHRRRSEIVLTSAMARSASPLPMAACSKTDGIAVAGSADRAAGEDRRRRVLVGDGIRACGGSL